ncbi:MAG: YceI family protein [Saprospiraceae bacterium]|nr:YceI family protein [Saprospiraceae bacterium]HRD82294.1 YceI family protein [Saprospiraceae bacterium]
MKNFLLPIFIAIGLCLSLESVAQTGIFKTTSGRITFRSEAPLELIEAASKELSGVLDAAQRTFAFSVPMQSFQGFNSALQREHFNENYMESTRFPKAVFTGKIIESTDLTQPGEYVVRAKGKLSLHGVEQERIIKVNIVTDKKGMTAHAQFSVLLEEYNISIPRVVYQKIAEEIQISVEAVLAKS